MQVEITDEKKRELRAVMKKRRAEMSPKERMAAGRSIQIRLLNSPLYLQSKVLLLYISQGTEVSTSLLLQHALAVGKTVGAPRCGAQASMEFFSLRNMSDLTAGSYGLLEPAPDLQEPLSPDSAALCVVPGLAFDEQGYRLGYGKGYYDRYLARYPCQTVGLCYENGRVNELPIDAYDRRVALVVTEKELYMTE